LETKAKNDGSGNNQEFKRSLQKFCPSEKKTGNEQQTPPQHPFFGEKQFLKGEKKSLRMFLWTSLKLAVTD
jgi:hypothetical protein